MTTGQRWLTGGTLGGAALIFSITLALSLAHDMADKAAVLRGAAWILVIVLTVAGVATVIVSIVRQQPTPLVVYADRESLRPYDTADMASSPEPQAKQLDTTSFKRVRAQRYVEQLDRLSRRSRRRSA